jgi:hypothetical protein
MGVLNVQRCKLHKEKKYKNIMLWITILFTIFVSNLGILSQILIIFITMYSEYKVYMITDKKKILTISKNITHSTFIDENKNPYGFFIGKKCAGFIHTVRGSNDNTRKELYILLHSRDYTVICLTKLEKTIEEKEDASVTVWSRKGNYWYIEYEKRSIEIELVGNEKQQKIIDEIEKYYNEYERGTFFISGDPGEGKSTMLRLLGKHFKANICKKMRLTEPGDTMDLLYNAVGPSKEAPIIVLFDEIDYTIKAVNNNDIVFHKHIPIEIYNTNTYNTFFDDVNDGLYPYLIVLLTSNKTKKEIDEMTHPCYLRKGRVNGYFTL